MKAAFIHDHYFVYNAENGFVYDGLGGVFDEKLWRRYLEVFDSLIVVGRQKESLPNRLVKSECENVAFELNNDLTSRVDRYTKQRTIKEKLKQTLSKVDFAIIRLPSVLGYIAQKICIEQNKKYVLEIVGDPFDAYWNYGIWVGKLIAPIELLRLKRAVSKAQYVIYVTKSMLQERYPCPNVTAAISNVRLEKVVEVSMVRDFYHTQSNIFKIGLIGSFHVWYKGHIEALKAIRTLKARGHSHIELHLVGTGNPNWVKDLARKYQVEDQVKIIGAVNAGDDGVYPFLDNIHLYIHPSKTEGLPRSILEAMSRGRMCLGSDVGGTKELLPENCIHKPGDWRTLAKQIERLISLEADERLKIAEYNLNVAEKYLESSLQKKRVKFLQNALKA